MIGTQNATSNVSNSTLPNLGGEYFNDYYSEKDKLNVALDIVPVTKNKTVNFEVKTSNNVVTDNSVEKFQVLAEWIGIVTEVYDSFFKAVVKDSQDGSLSEEIVEFDNNDLSERDQKLLQVEAVFYWTVGYQTIHKTKVKASKVEFRHTSPLSESIMEIVDKEALQLSDFFAKFK